MTTEIKKRSAAAASVDTTTTTTEEDGDEQHVSLGVKRHKSSENTALRHAYSVIAKYREFAYNTPDSPIYGENTETSMSRVLKEMGVGDSPENVFCDVGSGTGAPSIHTACEYPDILCYGFERMGSRWWISQSILVDLLRHSATQQAALRSFFAHLDLLDLQDFGPCTHVYSFDLALPPPAMEAYAKAFNASAHIKVLASFRKPAILEEWAFERLTLRTSFPMRQIGSGECRKIYIYDVAPRSDPPPPSENQAPWNITERYAPPTERMVQPNVPHTEEYRMGESARIAGVEAYKKWVTQSIGADRSTKMRTRRG